LLLGLPQRAGGGRLAGVPGPARDAPGVAEVCPARPVLQHHLTRRDVVEEQQAGRSVGTPVPHPAPALDPFLPVHHLTVSGSPGWYPSVRRRSSPCSGTARLPELLGCAEMLPCGLAVSSA